MCINVTLDSMICL